MGIRRIVDTDFWLDDKVIDLFSPEDRYFLLYLLTNPHTTQLGIYPINKKVIAFEMGYSLETVKVLLERFEKKYDMIRYSEKTSEVAIKNYLRHSVIKGGKPVEDLLRKEISKVKDQSLLRYVYKKLETDQNLNQTVKSLLPLLNVNDNDNDNDNEVSYTESYNDSYNDSCNDTPKRKRFSPPTLEEVRAYCEERKNGIDPERFIDFYSARGWQFKNGQPVKDWKACIRTWEQRNRTEEKKPASFEASDLDKFINQF